MPKDLTAALPRKQEQDTTCSVPPFSFYLGPYSEQSDCSKPQKPCSKLRYAVKSQQHVKHKVLKAVFN